MKQEWYQLSLKQTAEALGSDPSSGLTAAEAAKRLAANGPNELREKQRETLLQKFINQFKDFLVLILIAASIVSALVGEIADSVVIIAIVILNAALGVFQEAKAEKALEALKRMAAPNSKVIRDGNLLTVPSRELVVGDVVILEAGDYVPADVRILEAINLKVEEASLTGESVPVEKNAAVIEGDVPLGDRHNMGFMSTIVTYGRGKGMVIGTGMQTEIGKIAEMLQSYEEEQTPLQRKLEEFGKYLGTLCLVVCAIVFALGIYNGYRDGTLSMSEIQLLLMTAISLAVAAIPEGLPAVVTIVLALGMQRMVKKNSIVKKLHAVETLGSTTVICSDKTGTLTQNQMTVVKAFAGDAMYDVSGEGYNPQGSFSLGGQPVAVQDRRELDMLLRGAVLCNDAKLRHTPAESKPYSIIGDPTEGALIVAGAKGGYDREAANGKFPRLQEIPFDSNRKMMTTFHRGDNGKIIAFVKGAPDILLSRCTAIAAAGGVRHLTPNDIETIGKANSTMASEALRVLAVGYREFQEVPASLEAEAIETDLVFIGLLGMIDPPRNEAREAVKICAMAGIRPIMITGDHPDTAFAIARDLGIAQDCSQVITGQTLDSMAKEDLQAAVKSTNVFARVSPEHKVAIVDALKSNHEIAAMTGDGVNDAPALKRADIGVAMGITGTDVTKETADMVLTDDNFASIVAAVEEGRVIFTNIRKFVFFLLSCNVAEILVIFVAMLLGWAVPLLPIQLLWLNLVTDAFPALALGMEKKEPDVMEVKPRDPKEPLLNKNMLIMIGIQSSVIMIAVLGAFKYALLNYNGDLTIARTFAFVTLISSELLRAYSTRSEHFSAFSIGFFSNKYMNMGVAVSFALLLLSLYGPLQPVFKTYTLGLNEWGIIAGFATLPFIAGELGKKLLDVSGTSQKQSACTLNS
ncbi:MAG: cation-translocating P-type ATPase [Negativicutes bacterium]|nr:cation-translocating P-type ATPase [Negativicutes bacterium]